MGIFANFWVTTDVRGNRLKVGPDLVQFGENCSVLLETFMARLSENSEIWHGDRYTSDTSSGEIGRSVTESGGSYNGSKGGIFHTFLHVKTTVFETCEIEAVLLHSR